MKLRLSILFALLAFAYSGFSQMGYGFAFTTKNATASGGTPTYVGKGTEASGVGGGTVILPGSLATNDLMILATETNIETVTAPAGWTQFSFSPYNNSSNITRLTLFYKRYVSGDANPVIADPGDHFIAQVFAFRGVTTIGDGTSLNVQSGFSAVTAFTIPQGTTTDANQLVSLFIADGADVATNRFVGLGTNASLTSLTQRESIATNLGDGGGLNLYTGIKATPGSCGNLTGTLATGTGFACISISLTGTPSVSIPLNTIIPAITGTPSTGETLTCSTGSWNSIGTPTYAYQWTKNGVDISGETSNTYLVDITDDLSSIGCDVIATNSSGSSAEVSAADVYISDITNSSITSNHIYSGADRMLIYLPAGYYSNSDLYRVVIFYHGNGERGSPVDAYSSIGTGNGVTTVYSGNLTNTDKIIHSSAYVTVNGAVVATGHLGTFSGTGVTGTYNYDDGSAASYSVTFTTPPTNTHPIVVYFTQSNLLAQGPFRYLNLGDSPNTIYACPQISRGTGGFTTSEWDDALDYLTTNFRIDEDRIYPTGLSLGGDMCDWMLPNANPGANYSFAAFVNFSPGSTAWTPAGGNIAWTNAANKGKLFVRGTADANAPTKVPSSMANANSVDREFPVEAYNYWGLGHNSAMWDTKGYNRKNRTDAAGSADFDYLDDFLFKYSLNAEEQAGLFVDYAQASLKSEDYRLAKRQVDNLTAGAPKTALLADLATLKTTIGNSVIIDCGTAFRSTAGNVNNLTTGAASTTLSNLIDDTGTNTGYTYTTVAATDATPTVIDDIGSLRVNGRQWGFELNTTRDGMRVDAAGTVGTLRFGSLNGASTYTLKIYVTASNSAWTNRAEAEAIFGGVTKYLYCDTQNFQYIEFNGLVPSSNQIQGTIASRLTASTERLFYIQALELIEE